MSSRASDPITEKVRALLVWDSEGSPPQGYTTTVLWRRFGDDPSRGVISMPRMVDEHADTFRSRYLAWVYALGEALVEGKRVVDHLEIRPGFSYWWVTSVAQRFNTSATSRIDDAVTAMALEQIVETERIEAIVLVSPDASLAATLQEYSNKSKMRFEWRGMDRAEPTGSLVRRVYRALPQRLRVMIFLAWYLWKNTPRPRDRSAVPVLDGRTTFIGTLVHLDRQAVATGQFLSNYWTLLVDLCLKARLKTNWLHNYFAQPSIPSAARAEEVVKRFSDHSRGLQAHALFESDLAFSVVRRALKDLKRLRAASERLKGLPEHFIPTGSRVNFWPLFEQELIDSLRGHSAVVNCLRLALYEKTLSRVPRQARGVYIQENQPWEMILIHAWRAAGHGELVGVPHTTVRYWDLRYFYDPRSYRRTGRNDLPTPNRVAVNGPVARTMYLDGGYPAAELVDVEALRYVHLLHAADRSANPEPVERPLRVLVCGDFLSSTTHRILSWVTIAAPSLPPNTSFVLKPHPAYPLDLSRYEGPPLEVTNAPLAELFPSCDVVFTGNLSSTAADAYCARVPVVQMLDGRGFNASPLRGLPGVSYVTDAAELSGALRDARRQAAPQPYFYLSADLPRWRELLGLPAASPRQAPPP